jgi:hypothetical protein
MRAGNARIVALELPLGHGRKRAKLIDLAEQLEVPVVPHRAPARWGRTARELVGDPNRRELAVRQTEAIATHEPRQLAAPRRAGGVNN